MKRRVLWAISSFFMASGATWLVALIWKQSGTTFAVSLAPNLLGAAILGLTLARVIERRTLAISFAAGATLLCVAMQFVAFSLHGAPARWEAPGYAETHHLLLAVLAPLIAASCAMPRLRGRREHRLLWLWISALMMLGTIVAPLTMITADRFLPLAGVLVVVLAPCVAGAMTQILAPYRAIWTCGGGVLFLIFLMLDQSLRGNTNDDGIVGPLCGLGIFLLLGALGARIGWRLFRNTDPRTPPATTTLPTASVRQGDV